MVQIVRFKPEASTEDPVVLDGVFYTWDCIRGCHFVSESRLLIYTDKNQLLLNTRKFQPGSYQLLKDKEIASKIQDVSTASVLYKLPRPEL